MNQEKSWKLSELPLKINVGTKTVLKSLPAAHSAFAKLKGITSTIPNQIILINTPGLKETKKVRIY
jgi:GTPase Era involved in 16S rRNA processing